MNAQELATLRAEVEAGYIKRINHEMTDEEASEYIAKDRLLFAIDKAIFTSGSSMAVVRGVTA